MIVLVDAYNVLKTMHSAHFIVPGTADRFVRKVYARAAAQGYRVEIVFDGGAGGQHRVERRPQGTTIYTGSKQSADEMIYSLVEQYRPNEVVVVSADRALRSAVSRLGAKLIDPQVFWDRIHTWTAQTADTHHTPAAVELIASGDTSVSGDTPVSEDTSVSRDTNAEINRLLCNAPIEDYDREDIPEQVDKRSSGYTPSKKEKQLKKLVERL